MHMTDLSVVAIPLAVLLSAIVVCITAAVGFGDARRSLIELRSEVEAARNNFRVESTAVRAELAQFRVEALKLIHELRHEYHQVDRRLTRIETKLEDHPT